VAEETLALLMKVRGARESAREVDRVGRKVRGIRGSLADAGSGVGMFERALKLLGTRMGMIIILGGLLSVTLGPPMLAAFALLTAAAVALGGALIPAFVLGAAAVARFKEQADKAGTAANTLKQQLAAFTKIWKAVVAPGADILFVKFGDVLGILAPLIKSMKGPLTMFARQMGTGMVVAARGVAQLGPQMRTVIGLAGPMVVQIARLVAPLLAVLMQLAIAGMPALQQLITWLTQFTTWLGPAIGATIAWESRTGTMVNILDVFWGVLKRVWEVLKDVAVIVWAVWKALEPTLIPAIIIAFTTLATVIDWVSKNIDWLLPVVSALLALFLIFVGTIAGPVVSIGLLIAALVILYNKSSLVRGIVAALIWWFKVWWSWMKIVWSVIRDSPIGLLIQWLGSMIGKLWKAAGGWDGIKAAFTAAYNWIAPKIQWLIDKFQLLWDKTKGARDAIGSVVGTALPGGKSGLASKQGLLGIPGVPVLAQGGTATRTGAAIVGDAGPEVISMKRGAQVTPLGHGGGDVWVAATLVMPDGQVLAQQTLKASRKRKASR
jgi:phage-related protein